MAKLKLHFSKGKLYSKDDAAFLSLAITVGERPNKRTLISGKSISLISYMMWGYRDSERQWEIIEQELSKLIHDTLTYPEKEKKNLSNL